MFDGITNNVISEISSSYESKTAIDEKLIDNYILALDLATVEQPSYFQKVIPLVNQTLLDNAYPTIDPTGALIKLLEKVLSYLNFQQIVAFYPTDFILENLFSVSSISILCLKILTLNVHQLETQEFLSSNNVVARLLKVFFDENTQISVLSSIETLVAALYSSEIHLLDRGQDRLYSVRKSTNAVLLARLLDLLLILVDKSSNLDPKLYNFNEREILTFSDDPLFLILLIQFYIKAIGTNLTIEGSITAVMTLYKKGELDDIVNSEVADLVAKMTYHGYKSLLSDFEIFKTYNLIKVFDKDEVEIKLLSKSNPGVMYSLNPSIYDDVLKNLPLFDHIYLPILLNFLASPQAWMSLKLKLTNEQLESLSKDKLFSLLLSMSKYKHTKEYLFNNLPNIMNNEVIESDIRNNDIWKLKLQILENLKHSEEVSGFGIWENKIEESYNLMKFGQSYKHVQPKVEVIDDTA
ncbi:HSM3 [Candida margitis]|uniref:HSM3 n=1 Tax=Candida margitis TaxID=1775924 RepID=UPI002226E5CF|nr:HSM3 [Candida margitis]KAI5970130.1 HSM3 [Candida margitis]